MTSHCRAALQAAGLPPLVLPSTPETPARLSDALRTIDRVTFLTTFTGVSHKVCTRCHAGKPLDDFHPGNGKMGRHAHCKTCRAAAGRRYRARRAAERKAA